VENTEASVFSPFYRTFHFHGTVLTYSSISYQQTEPVLMLISVSLFMKIINHVIPMLLIRIIKLLLFAL